MSAIEQHGPDATAQQVSFEEISNLLTATKVDLAISIR
jgi:hypothetical protein